MSRIRLAALIEATRAAVDFYNQVLMKDPVAGEARAYLRHRGYDTDTVVDFKLGYAPSDRSDRLVRELRSRGIKDRAMVDAGLARRGQGGGLYDYFRDRVMFPTYDIQGELSPRCDLNLVIHRNNGEVTRVPVICRLDTAAEVKVYNAGGVLQRFAQDFLEGAVA